MLDRRVSMHLTKQTVNLSEHLSEYRFTFRYAKIFFYLCFSLLLASGLVRGEPSFFDSSKQHNPDAVHYIQLAKNIAELGIYSRNDFGQGEPDLLRTPAFPLFIISTFSTNRPLVLYLAQAILVLGIAKIVYGFGCRLFNPRVGAIAAAFILTDLLLLISCFEAMAELLFLFLTVLGLEILSPPKNGYQTNRIQFIRWFIGGAIIGLSVLARPSNLYLPIVLILCATIALNAAKGRFRILFQFSVLLSIGFVLVVAPWIARNYQVFGIAKVTTIDKHNLIYFVGAGALQAKHGWSRKEAQEFIQQKYNIPDYSTLQNPWSSKDKNTRELYDSINPVATQIATDNIPMLVKSSAIGIIKASSAHSAGDIGKITGGQWRSTRDLANCSPHLILAFCFQMLHTVTYLFAAFLGMATLIFSRERLRIALIFLLLLGYFYLIVAMFGIDAVARSRVSCLPFLFILAGIGIDNLLVRFERRTLTDSLNTESLWSARLETIKKSIGKVSSKRR